jgi:SAM-dependent methyltransferase
MSAPTPHCPICGAPISISKTASSALCQGSKPHEFPCAKGIPILINDQNSVFRRSDFVNEEVGVGDITKGMYQPTSPAGWLRTRYRRAVRYLSAASVDLKYFSAQDAILFLKKRGHKIQVLVLGAGDLTMHSDATMDLICTDVALTDHVDYIADAHDIPFEADTFDLVIAAAVLEHVADPHRVVGEIHRVLKQDGYVFANTPFMQPIHLGVYDFTRFTITGYRRLFRAFREERKHPGNPLVPLA